LTKEEIIGSNDVWVTGRKAVIGSIWLSISNYICFIINFGGGILLARLLMPEDFGIVALSVSIVTIFRSLSGWGFSVAVIKEEKNVQEVANNIFFISFIMNFAILGLIFLSVIWLSNLYSKITIVVLLIIAIFHTLRSLSFVYSAVIRKYMQLRKEALIMINATVFSMGVGILLAFSKYGVWSLLWREVTFSALIFCGNFLFSPLRLKFSVNKKIIKDFFNFGRNIFFSGLSENILNRTDRIVVGSLTGIAPLGLYNRGLYISNMYNNLIGGVKGALLPTFSNIKSNKKLLEDTYTIVMRTIMHILIPFFLVLGLLSKEIILFLYGEKWLKVAPIFIILIIYGCLAPLFDVNKLLHFALGDSKTVAKTRLLQVAFFLPAIFLFTYFGGINGAAICLGIMTSMGFIVLLLSSAKKITVRYFDIFLLPILPAGIAFFMFLLFKEKIFALPSLFGKLMVSSIFILIVYVLSSFIIEKKALFKEIRLVSKIIKKQLK